MENNTAIGLNSLTMSSDNNMTEILCTVVKVSLLTGEKYHYNLQG
jgi:hypothetical protein